MITLLQSPTGPVPCAHSIASYGVWVFCVMVEIQLHHGQPADFLVEHMASAIEDYELCSFDACGGGCS